MNIGDRQKGRTAGENVINVDCEKDLIIKAFAECYCQRPSREYSNPYGKGETSEKIIEIILKKFN